MDTGDGAWGAGGSDLLRSRRRISNAGRLVPSCTVGVAWGWGRSTERALDSGTSYVGPGAQRSAQGRSRGTASSWNRVRGAWGEALSAAVVCAAISARQTPGPLQPGRLVDTTGERRRHCRRVTASFAEATDSRAPSASHSAWDARHRVPSARCGAHCVRGAVLGTERSERGSPAECIDQRAWGAGRTTVGLSAQLVVRGSGRRRRRQFARGSGRSRVRWSLGGEPSGPSRCYTACGVAGPSPRAWPEPRGARDRCRPHGDYPTLCSVRGGLVLVGGILRGARGAAPLIGTTGHCWPQWGWRMPSWASRQALSAKHQVPSAGHRDRCTRGGAPST
jgi:hypothetical protein